jgi:hypothetical protein
VKEELLISKYIQFNNTLWYNHPYYYKHYCFLLKEDTHVLLFPCHSEKAVSYILEGKNCFLKLNYQNNFFFIIFYYFHFKFPIQPKVLLHPKIICLTSLNSPNNMHKYFLISLLHPFSFKILDFYEVTQHFSFILHNLV